MGCVDSIKAINNLDRGIDGKLIAGNKLQGTSTASHDGAEKKNQTKLRWNDLRRTLCHKMDPVFISLSILFFYSLFNPLNP